MINLINKLITHSRDRKGDYGIRVVLHIPIGILMSIPILGWGLIALFIYYQKNEDYWTHDRAWKDVAGAKAGYVMGMLLIIGCLLFAFLL